MTQTQVPPHGPGVADAVGDGPSQGDLCPRCAHDLGDELTALRQANQFLEAIVEHIPHMVFVKEARDLRFRLFNRAGEELLGFARDELYDKNDYDFFPLYEADFFTEADRAVLRSGQPLDIAEEQIETAGMGRRYLHTKKVPILGADGEPEFLLGISEDITERKAVREELEQQREALEATNRRLLATEERLRALLGHFPGAVWTVDEAMRVTYSAGARLTDLGLERSLAIGERVADHLPAGVRGERAEDVHRAVLESQEPVAFDLEAGGRCYEVQLDPLRGDTPAAVIGVALDVTARREQESQRVSRRLAEARQAEFQSRLAGGVANLYNNLLTTILGHATFAQRSLSEGEDVAADLVAIRAAAEAAAELTARMRATSGAGHFVTEAIDLSRFVEDLAMLLAAASHELADVSVACAAGLPSVEADRDQLRELLFHLVANAAEACAGGPRGTVLVRTGAADVDEEFLRGVELSNELPCGRYVSIEVIDDGVGMSPEVRERAMEPFFATKPRGQGLGLAASRGIVVGHHGALGIDSQPGRGTRVLVLLPASDEAATPRRARISAATAPPVMPATVLVVDDEQGVRDLISLVLEREGIDVIAACDGREALRLFAEHGARISAVILDVTMPGMNGDETLRRLREAGLRAPVLVSSGFAEADVTHRFADLELAGYLPKPYSVTDLAGQVRGLLSME